MAWGFPDKSTARQWVWDRLAAEGVARFPFPPHGRIPNFAGAGLAAARLLEIEPWKSAKAIQGQSGFTATPTASRGAAPRHPASRSAAGQRRPENMILPKKLTKVDCFIYCPESPHKFP